MRRVLQIMAAVCALAASADADDPADAEHEAVRHLNLGIAAYKLGHYDEALRELTETNRISPDRANTHRWLALVQAKLGDCNAALAHIEGYMSRVNADDKRLPELVELRDRCLGNGTLTVESTPTGAGIRIDGGPIIGVTPYRVLAMRGGSHVVAAEKQGFVAASRSIVVPPAGQLSVRLELATLKTRSRSRWWIWAIGAAAVVTIVGVTYGVTRGDGEGRLPPIQCDPGGCR